MVSVVGTGDLDFFDICVNDPVVVAKRLDEEQLESLLYDNLTK